MVDTDVISFLFKRDSRNELYRPHLAGKLLVMSFMTVAELDRWALTRHWGQERCIKMAVHLRNFVVYPYDRALCRAWAEVSDRALRNGRPIQCADAWIAATALLQEIPLVTHNRHDYAGVNDLLLISEAEE